MAQIAERPSAEVLAFPSRAVPRRALPAGIDLSRATPADDAAVESLRRQTLAVLDARRSATNTISDSTERVASLLLAMENAPLAPVLAYPCRDIGGHPFVSVLVAGRAFRLLPEDCRTAATALIEDQAFAGCVGVAADLREAAALAEARSASSSGPLSPPTAARGYTGGHTMIGLAVVILCAVVLSAWAGH